MCFAGEVTAEELRQRLDGAKERMLSQPHSEQRSQATDSGEQQGGSGEGEERGAGGRQGAGREDRQKLLILLTFDISLITEGGFVEHCVTMLMVWTQIDAS